MKQLDLSDLGIFKDVFATCNLCPGDKGFRVAWDSIGDIFMRAHCIQFHSFTDNMLGDSYFYGNNIFSIGTIDGKQAKG